MGLFDAILSPSGPVLRGGRVVLRTPRMRDFEAWRKLREESREFLMPWEPLWTPDELTRKAYRMRLNRYLRETQERSGFTFFLKDAGTDELFGGLTLGLIRRGVAQTSTLGYWMGERHAGKGLMREAVELLKPFVFEVEGLHRIEAACLPSNARSIRLLERCGFRREGYLQKYLKIAGSWEDHHLYSLVAEDWAAELARQAAASRDGGPADRLARPPPPIAALDGANP
ncbi:GNAT family N-acetyltransferase [Aureimonas leprariae]|uniref:GNAT family N-acetyltransferase n=1 Tax=Plantimonas leprariae TaxID=2615207 RepID=A0A7V7TWG2_9HYPH|nr:GNAT family protein [Aureimonas leprariae]KAB0679570.1 GNAT family N-acetyltransferase [Aureimonas leprariae]